RSAPTASSPAGSHRIARPPDPPAGPARYSPGRHGTRAVLGRPHGREQTDPCSRYWHARGGADIRKVPDLLPETGDPALNWDIAVRSGRKSLLSWTFAERVRCRHRRTG